MINKVKKIVSVFLILIAIGLGIYITNVIKDKNTEYELISGIDERVIVKLRTIREIENAFFAVNNRFTDNWDTLGTFVDKGQFVITDRNERIVVRPYGGDSIVVTIDTLGVVLVKDSLFNTTSLPDLKTFYLSPESNTPFTVSTLEMKGDHFIEVVDSEPLNPDRKKGGKLKPLKFGSLSESTLRGNWEK